MEKNREADSYQTKDKKIELLLQEAYGYSDEQLLQELEKAEAEAQSAEMEEQTSSLQAPPDEFETILAKMKERGIQPQIEKELSDSDPLKFAEPDDKVRSAETEEPERPPESERPHRISKTVWRVLIAAAIAGSLLLATGIGVGGRRALEYKADIRDGQGSNIAWDNESENLILHDEEEAYQEIEEKLGIPVLKLKYRPDGMRFEQAVIEDGYAVMDYSYKEKMIYVILAIGTDVNSDNITSDRVAYKSVYNKWLDEDIVIEKGTEVDEFSAVYEQDKQYYYVEGIMEEEEFVKMIVNMKF